MPRYMRPYHPRTHCGRMKGSRAKNAQCNKLSATILGRRNTELAARCTLYRLASRPRTESLHRRSGELKDILGRGEVRLVHKAPCEQTRSREIVQGSLGQQCADIALERGLRPIVGLVVRQHHRPVFAERANHRMDIRDVAIALHRLKALKVR